MRWLNGRFFAPLSVLTTWSVLLILTWEPLFGPWTGPRLLWNLFLAWVPYLVALSAIRLHQIVPQDRWIFWCLIAIWFVFLPNAPYLVTDLLYLPLLRQPWFSAVLLTSFLVTGLFLTGVSLYLVQTVVAAHTSRGAGNAVAGAAILLCGVGVYLGRYVRLNTWELLTDPQKVAVSISKAAQPEPNRLGFAAFAILMSLLVAVVYIAIVQLRHAHWTREENAVWTKPDRSSRRRGSRQ